MNENSLELVTMEELIAEISKRSLGKFVLIRVVAGAKVGDDGHVSVVHHCPTHGAIGLIGYADATLRGFVGRNTVDIKEVEPDSDDAGDE